MRGVGRSGLAGLILWLWCVCAWSQALPAYTGNVNQAVGSLVTQKLINRGFAANDPRIAQTLSSMGTYGRQAVGVAANDARYVAQRSLGRIFLRASPIGAVLMLASDATFTNIDQDKAQLAGAALSGTVVSDPSSGVVAGGGYWSATGAKGSDPQSVGWQSFTVDLPWETWSFGPYQQANWTATRKIYQGSRWHPTYCAAGGCQVTTVYVDWVSSGAPINCGPGSYINGSNQCVAYSYNLHNAPTYTPTPKAVEDLARDAPAALKAKPLPDQALADLTNQWWDAAAANDPNAIPRAQTDPVTAPDVATWKAANPTKTPTVSDWFAPPVPNTTSTTVPVPQPATSPGTTPSTDPATNPATPGQGTQVDLGPDPNTPPPSLETTPTIQAIVGPLLNLMPDLKSFTVPGHTSQCPTAHFDLSMVHLGAYTIDAHCNLFDQNRAVIQAAMLVVWTLAAVFIVLRA